MISDIAIFDLATGQAETLLKLDVHVEAPNWTPDGAALIVNKGGRIFRVALDAPELVEIDTGFASRCNNDHGLSPDGAMLAISDSTEENASTVYILPVTGGTPKRVTPTTPCYWHGWSPDGARLAYVSKRGQGFQVYTCELDGSDEVQVTHDFDHTDGPDYTPDGQWIWFNGEKAGSVQLWRVHPDGTGLERMTDDERVNWFPHPSPDGQHIAYLAYEPGTTGHPGDRNVQLRLMPAGGGSPRILLDMFGGQGTINVPSWSPDSMRFAFVRYEK